MHIRTATAADAQNVREIIELVYVGGGWADPDTAPEYVRSLLAAAHRIEHATVLLATVDEVPVGTITAAQNPPYANIAGPGELEVRMLGVVPPARRRGVARALVLACHDLARAAGAERVVLSTETAMTAARALYEDLGYERTPDRDWVINGFPLITYGRAL